MLYGGTQKSGRRHGSLEVEVGTVFPGEADATVDLNGLRRDLAEDVRAIRLGQARGRRQVGFVEFRRPRRVVNHGGSRLDRYEHVRAAMFYRLEAADRPAELHPRPGVIDARLQAQPSRADMLCGPSDRRE